MKPIYAIGDVHGCFDQAKNAIIAIDRYHRKQGFSGKPRIIWLGDYVDRGPDSYEVLELLIARSDECVLGNHEQAMYRACIDVEHARYWLKWGGGATLVSYGHDQKDVLDVIHALIYRDRELDLTKINVNIVPQKHVDWLTALPTKIETDNHFFCHAGINPDLDFNHQDDNTLLYIRDPFLEDRRIYPKLVVHGHSIVGNSDKFKNPRNRVNLDYGAYYRGSLCIGVFDDSIPGGSLIEKLMVNQFDMKY